MIIHGSGLFQDYNLPNLAIHSNYRATKIRSANQLPFANDPMSAYARLGI